MKRMRLKASVFAFIAIIGIGNTAEVIAQEEGGGFAGTVSILVEFLGATYASTALHEFGHYSEAESFGLSPNIRLGLIQSGTKGGNFALYLGKTSYGDYPKDQKIKSALSLAGMESSKNAYEALDGKIRDGEIKGRFSSIIALLCGTDFPRYTLIHSLKNSPDQLDDIEAYCINTAADETFIYTAALLDLLFNWNEITFHAQRALGRNPLVPQKREIFGLEANPKVFVQSNMGIAVGFGLKKRW